MSQLKRRRRAAFRTKPCQRILRPFSTCCPDIADILAVHLDNAGIYAKYRFEVCEDGGRPVFWVTVKADCDYPTLRYYVQESVRHRFSIFVNHRNCTVNRPVDMSDPLTFALWIDYMSLRPQLRTWFEGTGL